jgi:excisionase family DNA binding protein
MGQEEFSRQSSSREARVSVHFARMPERPDVFPPVLTAALAAELLQVHVEYLRRMVRDGRLPCHRLPGGRGMRFIRDELLDWLALQPGENQSATVRLDIRR